MVTQTLSSSFMTLPIRHIQGVVWQMFDYVMDFTVPCISFIYFNFIRNNVNHRLELYKQTYSILSLCYEPCAQIEFPALYCPELDKLLQFFKYFFPQAVLNFQELSVFLHLDMRLLSIFFFNLYKSVRFSVHQHVLSKGPIPFRSKTISFAKVTLTDSALADLHNTARTQKAPIFLFTLS